jgi:hypothetical protein
MHSKCAALLISLTAFPAMAAETSQAKPVMVPFEVLKSRHIAVKVLINGKGPYRVIFDTGAPMLLLNTKVARAAGLSKGPAGGSPFGFLGSLGEATIKTFELGGAKAENLPTIIMDHPTVELISRLMGPIEGIVGFPFFAQYKTTIDYQAQKLTLVPNGYQPPDPMQSLMSTVIALVDDQPRKPKILAPAGLWGLALEKAPGDDEDGVTVKVVLPESPAAKAGIKTGDRLLTIDGRWTDTLADAYFAASFAEPGIGANVTIRRDDKEIRLSVKPAAGL